MSLKNYLEQAAELLHNMAADESLQKALAQASDLTCQALVEGLPVLVCGNGGSAADAQHITAELVGRFLQERQALNVICLSANVATLTALGNDYGYDAVFARQVEAYGRPGGVLIGLSTSGNSRNVVNAFQVAREQGMKTIAFTGQTGGLLQSHSDKLIAVPSTHTPAIQQLHLCLYHYFCQAIENYFYKVSIDSVIKFA
jgi:D-sedoheptulose 7-phosphate isomerase